LSNKFKGQELTIQDLNAKIQEQANLIVLLQKSIKDVRNLKKIF
jgi:hypothetical protein